MIKIDDDAEKVFGNEDAYNKVGYSPKSLLVLILDEIINVLAHLSNENFDNLMRKFNKHVETGKILRRIPFDSEVDVSALQNGIYFLRIITTERKQYYSKFIKE